MIKLRIIFSLVVFTFFASPNVMGQDSYLNFIKKKLPEKSAYLDSIINVFNVNTRKEVKTSLAFQLYKEYDFNEERVEVLADKLDLDKSEIQSWAKRYKTYLLEEAKVLEDPTMTIEFHLLTAKSKVDFDVIEENLKKNQILNEEIDSLFRSLLILKKNYSAYKNKEIKSKHFGQINALKIIPKNTKYLYLLSSVCHELGYYYYHNQQLDSASFYYSFPNRIYEKDRSKQYLYIPGQGANKRTSFMGACLMNLGLIYERKGNLVKATDCFKEANTLFSERIGFNEQWSRMRLMNAFFDIGDNKSAKAQLRTMAKKTLPVLGKLQRYGPHIFLSVLNELDIDQLQNNADLVDSIMRTEIEHFYSVNNINTIDNDKKRVFYYSSRAEFVLYDYIFQGLTANRIPIFGMDEIGKCYSKCVLNEPVSEDEQKKLNKIETYNYGIRLINAADYNVKLTKLNINLAKNGSLDEQMSLLIQLAHLFDIYKARNAELAMLKKVQALLENTEHKVELGKVYKQLAKCYENLDQFKIALAFKNKFDSVTLQIDQINQHANLAKLDKELKLTKTLRDKAITDKQNEALLYKKNKLHLVIGALILIAMLLFGLFYLNRRRILAERQQLAHQNKALEVNLQSEEEKVKRASLEILKSNQSFSQLVQDVEAIKGELSTANRRKLLGLLISHKTKSQDDIWQQFNLQFENHYQGFYEKLNVAFSLTENEKRLCAMHISGLNNQEINAVTGQKLNSIYTMKSKVRKKMDVESDDELTKLLKLFT